jgi:CelD/BcsL family acetyltransferase involved in cellulose biosynthesis
MGLPLRALELASNVFCYHAEIVSAGELDQALGEFLAHRGLPRWDVFRADNLVSNGRTAQAIRSFDAFAHVSTRPAEQSPYAVIDRNWTAYLATRAKKVRANVLRSQRVMKEAGETAMSWYEAKSDARRLLDEMLQIETRSWKAGAGAAIVAGTPQCAYYERLLPWLSDIGAIMANVLYVKERPCAYTLCATWRGWIGQLKTSFDQDLRDAGSRVMHSSLERAFHSGGTEYDFLGDVAPHKTRWADAVRPHEDLWGFSKGLRSRAFAKLKALADRRHDRRAKRTAPEQAEQSESS